MEDKQMIKMVEEYQCPGCVCGSGIECYEKSKSESYECSKHVAGTMISHLGTIFLGMPKGFNRIGVCKDMKIKIFKKFSDGFGFDKLNVPVWKYLDKHKNTIVRGIMPRLNEPFLHIFAGNVLWGIDCIEIKQEDLDGMD